MLCSIVTSWMRCLVAVVGPVAGPRVGWPEVVLCLLLGKIESMATRERCRDSVEDACSPMDMPPEF